MPQLVQPMAFLGLGGELNQVDPIKPLQAVGKVELSVFRKLHKLLIYLVQPWLTIHTIYNLHFSIYLGQPRLTILFNSPF